MTRAALLVLLYGLNRRDPVALWASGVQAPEATGICVPPGRSSDHATGARGERS
jgi:hypothetical protein